MKVEYTKEGVKFGDEFISLDDIITNVNKAKVKEEKLVMMVMEWGYSRGFDGIQETIVLPIDKVNRIKEIITGKVIYFGEINGKHSDIHGPLDADEITIIEDEKTINEFLSENPSGHDYNHSFLDVFSNYASDGQYDDVTIEIANEFDTLY